MGLLNAIDSAVGIQREGVTDQSSSVPAVQLVNGLIVGDFGRGRVDQPMFITKDTLAQLGDESKPAYQAVADCLDTGVSGVWVLRVSTVKDEVVLPPARLFLVSKLYPVDVVESFTGNATVLSGSLRIAPSASDVEMLNSHATITGGDLRSVLRYSTMQPESITGSATVTGGDLRALLRQYDYSTGETATESVTSSATITGGVLRALLIQNTTQPEAITSGATIISGVLQ